MADKTRTTKSGDPVALFIDEENKQYVVRWYNLCGYDAVTMHFAFLSQATAFFNALLNVTEVEED